MTTGIFWIEVCPRALVAGPELTGSLYYTFGLSALSRWQDIISLCCDGSLQSFIRSAACVFLSLLDRKNRISLENLKFFAICLILTWAKSNILRRHLSIGRFSDTDIHPHTLKSRQWFPKFVIIIHQTLYFVLLIFLDFRPIFCLIYSG